MILILIAIVATTVITGLLFWHAGSNYDWKGTLAAVTGAFLAVATGICGVVYATAGWGWIASQHKADIVNREYGTKYTREEIFWASDVIETVRELDRKRYEVNGDLARDTKR